MSQSLFRPQAIAAQSPSVLGNVLLATPLQFHIVAWVAFAIAASIVALLFFGGYAGKDTVTGWITTTEANVRIFPQAAGTVSEIFVSDGSSVSLGTPLLRVSTARAAQATDSVGAQVRKALENEARSLHHQLDQQELLFANRRQALQEQLIDTQRQIDMVNSQLEITRQRQAIANTRLERLDKAVSAGFGTPVEREQALAEQLDQLLRVGDLQRELSRLGGRLEQTRIELAQLPMDKTARLTELHIELDRLNQRLAEAQVRESYLIRASTAGQVSGLNVRIGQALSPAVPVLSIMPERAEFYAELLVPIRVAPAVREGAQVMIRYDAFAPQKFGTYTGQVSKILRSVVMPDELQAPITIAEPSYVVKVHLEQQRIATTDGQLALQVGMKLTADILRDSRTIIEWIFDPLLNATGRFG